MALTQELQGQIPAGVHTLGGFIPLAFSGPVESSRGPILTEFVSVEGQRTAYVTADPSRSWQVKDTVPRSWQRMGERLSSGAFGWGPWVFVDPKALRTNALRRGFGGDTVTATMVEDEPAALVSGSTLISGAAGVIPGQTVTASAVTTGVCSLVLEFLAASGGVVASRTLAAAAGVSRPSITAEVPATAAQARIRVSASGVTLAGEPQLVLGTEPGPLHAPAGLGLVSIQWDPITSERHQRTPGDDMVEISFKILEVAADG